MPTTIAYNFIISPAIPSHIMKSFAELGVKKEIVHALEGIGYVDPLEVQEKIIPLALQKKNLVFTAKTGSGKTLAFTIAFLARINKKHALQMIILVPSRELCIQVGKEIKRVCEPLGINVGMLYGGREIVGDYRTLNKKNHIIIGTPGRLIQHINEKNIKVGDVSCLVFDESDHLFEEGFYEDCAYLRERVSNNSQIILASATITATVERFIKEEIKEFLLVRVGVLIPENIVQEKVYCKRADKEVILQKILSQKRVKRSMVFCNMKSTVTWLSGLLNEKKMKARPISNDVREDDRLNYLNLFKEGKVHVLIATDVAARGLHIEDVDLIVNYDIPTRKEFYVHRIGRTGRNDKPGHAITIICPEEKEQFQDIEAEFGLSVRLREGIRS